MNSLFDQNLANPASLEHNRGFGPCGGMADASDLKSNASIAVSAETSNQLEAAPLLSNTKTASISRSLIAERWLPVPGFESRYDVSDFGRVRNRFTGRVMKTSPNDKGYLYLSLHIDGAHRKPRLHILVAKAFVERPEGATQVNHENTIKADCRAGNLKWMTGDENMRHAVEHGLIWRGDQINTAKLNDGKATELLELHRGGMTTRELSERYGIKPNTVSRIVTGRTWKHITRPSARFASPSPTPSGEAR